MHKSRSFGHAQLSKAMTIFVLVRGHALMDSPADGQTRLIKQYQHELMSGLCVHFVQKSGWQTPFAAVVHSM